MKYLSWYRIGVGYRSCSVRFSHTRLGAEPCRQRQRATVTLGRVSLGKQSVPERVLPIRRIRGWVGAESIRPRAAARGDTRPLLRSSIRMACKGRLAGLPTPTAASQLSPNPQHCQGETCFSIWNNVPGKSPGRDPSGNATPGSRAANAAAPNASVKLKRKPVTHLQKRRMSQLP